MFADDFLMHLKHAGDTLVCHEVQDYKSKYLRYLFASKLPKDVRKLFLVSWVGIFVINVCKRIVSLLVSVIWNHVLMKRSISCSLKSKSGLYNVIILWYKKSKLQVLMRCSPTGTKVLRWVPPDKTETHRCAVSLATTPSATLRTTGNINLPSSLSIYFNTMNIRERRK